MRTFFLVLLVATGVSLTAAAGNFLWWETDEAVSYERIEETFPRN